MEKEESRAFGSAKASDEGRGEYSRRVEKIIDDTIRALTKEAIYMQPRDGGHYV